MAGTGKPAPGWTFKPFVVVNDREPPWLYTGTRFVSPLSEDVANVFLYEDRTVAEQVANHLNGMGVCSGIDESKAQAVLADYMTAKNARLPPVVKNYVREVSRETVWTRRWRARRVKRPPIPKKPFPWSGGNRE